MSLIPERHALQPERTALAWQRTALTSIMLLLPLLVVATRVGGVGDVLGGDAGLLVPSGDAAAMAAALRDTVVHPERARDRAVAAGRRLAARYSVAPWIEAHVQLYRSVAG